MKQLNVMCFHFTLVFFNIQTKERDPSIFNGKDLIFSYKKRFFGSVIGLERIITDIF